MIRQLALFSLPMVLLAACDPETDTSVDTDTGVDSDTDADSDSDTAQANRRPTPPTVVLNTDPSASDDLVVQVTTASTDPDGDDLQYVTTWFRNGELQVIDGDTVTSLFTSAGDTWRVEMVASDGELDSVPGSASVTVLNTAPNPPVLGAAETVTTTDGLVASIVDDATDPDGDALSYTYSWSNQDGVQASQTGPTVAAEHTEKGDVWTVDVVATDGTAESTASSQTFTIVNSAPTAPTVDVEVVVEDCYHYGLDAGDSMQFTTTSANDDAHAFAIWYRVDNLDNAVTLASGDGFTLTVSEGGLKLSLDTGSFSIRSSAITGGTWSLAWVSLESGRWRMGNNTVNYTSGFAAPSTVNWTIGDDDTAIQVGAIYGFDGAFDVGDDVFQELVDINDLNPTDVWLFDEGDGTIVANESIGGDPIVVTGGDWALDCPEPTTYLVCNVSTPSTDADGDDISYAMTWERDCGVALTDEVDTTVYAGDTAFISEPEFATTLTCMAVADDGETQVTASASETHSRLDSFVAQIQDSSDLGDDSDAWSTATLPTSDDVAVLQTGAEAAITSDMSVGGLGIGVGAGTCGDVTATDASILIDDLAQFEFGEDYSAFIGVDGGSGVFTMSGGVLALSDSLVVGSLVQDPNAGDTVGMLATQDTEVVANGSVEACALDYNLDTAYGSLSCDIAIAGGSLVTDSLSLGDGDVAEDGNLDINGTISLESLTALQVSSGISIVDIGALDSASVTASGSLNLTDTTFETDDSIDIARLYTEGGVVNLFAELTMERSTLTLDDSFSVGTVYYEGTESFQVDAFASLVDTVIVSEEECIIGFMNATGDNVDSSFISEMSMVDSLATFDEVDVGPAYVPDNASLTSEATLSLDGSHMTINGTYSTLQMGPDATLEFILDSTTAATSTSYGEGTHGVIDIPNVTRVIELDGTLKLVFPQGASAQDSYDLIRLGTVDDVPTLNWTVEVEGLANGLQPWVRLVTVGDETVLRATVDYNS